MKNKKIIYLLLIIGIIVLASRSQQKTMKKTAGETVVFRQSAYPDTWTNLGSGDWVVYDMDGDGNLEAFGYDQSTYDNLLCNPQFYTADGHGASVNELAGIVYVWTSSTCSPTVSSSRRYFRNSISAPTAQLSTSPVTGYSTREVYHVCTDTSWSPEPSTVCSGVSFTQTSNCGTTRSVTGTKICGGAGSVIFRQSAAYDSWSAVGNGAWIAADRDANGVLEGYGYYVRSTSSSGWPSVCQDSYSYNLTITPEGYAVRISDSYSTRMYVCFKYGNIYYGITFYSTDSDANNAVLSTDRVAGYEAREVLYGNVIPPQCTAGTCCDTSTQKFKSSSTVCGAQDCDSNDVTCRDYNDINIFCTGSSADCPTTATCNSYTNAAFGTLCSEGAGGMCSSGNCLSISYSTFTSQASQWSSGAVTYENFIIYGSGWVNS